MRPELIDIPRHRHAGAAERLRRAVLADSGCTPRSLREAIVAYASELWLAGEAGSPIPGELESYVEKVVRHPYKVLDEDVEALRAAGYSEDQVFEITIAPRSGAACRARDRPHRGPGRRLMRLRLLDDGHAPAEREGLREWEELAGTVSDVTLAPRTDRTSSAIRSTPGSRTSSAASPSGASASAS
ncbi:MAG TPA: hypothetical protein VK919_06725 [Solirubrobacterales bacterium]|nr:hypothetical protein [Solirubrobacterales bacterium]